MTTPEQALKIARDALKRIATYPLYREDEISIAYARLVAIAAIAAIDAAEATPKTPHDFFLQSDEEIDKFAAICKAMLKQANDVTERAKQ